MDAKHLKEIDYTFLKGAMLDPDLHYEGREHLQEHDAYTSTERFKKMLEAYKKKVDECPEQVCACVYRPVGRTVGVDSRVSPPAGPPAAPREGRALLFAHSTDSVVHPRLRASCKDPEQRGCLDPWKEQ
jgi:hypothetical protein